MTNEKEICKQRNYNQPHDFEALDKKIDFRYRQDLYKLILSTGYEHVSEYVFDAYFNKKFSMYKIALFLQKSKTNVSYWMRTWNFKKRRQGGNQTNKNLLDPDFIKRIKDSKDKISCRKAQIEFDCSYGTIKKLWMEAA